MTSIIYGKVRRVVIVMPWHISERGGGAEVQANYLGQELAQRGFDVYYLCQTIKLEKVGTTIVIGDLHVNWLKQSGKFQWLDQNKYFKALEKLKPDLVIQRLSSNVTFVAGKYCRKNNARFVWICTDNLSPYRNHSVRRFKQRFSQKNISLLRYFIFLLNSKIIDYYRNRGMKYVDLAFTQNDFQAEVLEREFGLSSQRMISGHPLPEKNISVKQRLQNKIVLWCGNLGKYKRPEIFIHLAKKMQDSGLHFVMVGGHSDSKYVDGLFANAPSNLDYIGQVSFKDSLQWFDKAAVLVNTSISEGFSNTYIQAWLRGVPVIVFGADPDNIIQKNKLGYGVLGLSDAMVKISRLFCDIRAYKTLSENVAAYAYGKYTREQMTDNFLSSLQNQ